MRRILLVPYIMTALVVCCTAALAQAYPSQTIRFVIPYPPGGPSDVIGRMLADKLKTSLGQTTVVENKSGAAGMVAMADLLSRPKDGHTLHQCSYIDANNTAVFKKVSYKLDDITPVTLVSKSYYALTIANHIPANTVDEFIRYAKSRPGELTYGRVGAGGITELLVRQFDHLAGIKTHGVTFRGTPHSVQEMLGGRLDFVIGPPNTVLPLHEAKKLKVIGVTSPERLPAAPDIPTLSEQKIPITYYGWWGMCVASGTPKPIVDLLNRTLTTAVESDDFKWLMEQNGMIAVTSSSEELARMMVETARDTARLMREVGIEQLD